MDQIVRSAYAKVNLGLAVTGKRADGYHLVDMVMQTIDLYDTLEFRKDPDSREIILTITQEDADRNAFPAGTSGGKGTAAGVSDAETGRTESVTGSKSAVTLSSGNDNLICRAAEAFRTAYGVTEGVRIHLTKRIPMAAGMAGGSADAAATLLAMRDLFEISASLDELERIGVTLGADIPYCLEGGTKRCEGIGEILTPLSDAPCCSIVIVKPPVGVSTPAVYRGFDAMVAERDTAGAAQAAKNDAIPTSTCADSIAEAGGNFENAQVLPVDIPALVAGIEDGDYDGMCRHLGNALEPVTRKFVPEVRQLEAFLLAHGADRAMMTGSGPTVFALFREKDTALAAFRALREHPEFGKFASFATRFIRPDFA